MWILLNETQARGGALAPKWMLGRKQQEENKKKTPETMLVSEEKTKFNKRIYLNSAKSREQLVGQRVQARSGGGADTGREGARSVDCS